MIVTGWRNGITKKSGAGYGIRVTHKDRDMHFQKGWLSVIIELEKEDEIEVNLTESFWRKCSELRSAQIGRWLLNHNLAPWVKYNPPSLKLMPLEDRKFRLMINHVESNRTEEPIKSKE